MYQDDPPLPEDDENKEKRTDDISSWDAEFLKGDQGTLFELIIAANYMDIKVFYIACKATVIEVGSQLSAILLQRYLRHLFSMDYYKIQYLSSDKSTLLVKITKPAKIGSRCDLQMSFFFIKNFVSKYCWVAGIIEGHL